MSYARGYFYYTVFILQSYSTALYENRLKNPGHLLDGRHQQPAHHYRAVYHSALYSAVKRSSTTYRLKGNLTADQMTFINNIISFLEQNGVIEASTLFQEPFTHVNDQGLLGVFDEANAHKVIGILDGIK